MKPILEIRNISKKFLIDHERPSYLSFRDRITSVFKKGNKPEEFWALKDVSFDVNPGDSIGIIGRNGAGKSTLLKILSRITPPTTGHIIARGRVASLLEVGTGFHQELTGRENIFMNGSILGMKKAEIRKKFDEIVDFSGVEKFLDTPLKHYSSGMQLRLAFAVAAHLEPEILIVDEVLAVGDAEFQKKCLGKMEEVSKGGRTILFVSHNLEALEKLCEKGIYLNLGKAIECNRIQEAISRYYAKKNDFVGTESDAIKKLKILAEGSIINLSVDFELDFELEFPNLGFVIYDPFGRPICGTNFLREQIDGSFEPTSSGTIQVKITQPTLSPGQYQVMVWLGDKRENFFKTTNPVHFEIIESQGKIGNSKVDGFVVPVCSWTFS